MVLSLRIELSFKVGRVGTLGERVGRVRVGTLGGGLGTLGVNLNLLSSSSSKLRLRLTSITFINFLQAHTVIKYLAFDFYDLCP